ncbi:MAG: DUF6672 family protein [Oscillospiraceae bacterium]
MKNKRSILFRVGAVVLLLAIAGVMMIIGRGHTVYIDNKAIDYNGQSYTAPYKAVLSSKGEQFAKLYNNERGMTTCIGQKFTMTLEITQKKGGKEETSTVSLTLPYNMDNIAINLPAFLAGLPEEAYLSTFQPLVEEPEEPEELPSAETPELALGDV